MEHAVPPPDFDDIPTSDLEPPTSDEIPLATLANTLAIRGMRRDIREMRDAWKLLRTAVITWGLRIVAAIVSGAIAMSGTLVGMAMARGEEREQARHIEAETARHDVRITKLEERQWE